MRICHITPHLPPDQAANALLPFHLGLWARDVGDEPCYVAHPPRAGRAAAQPGPVTWVPARRRDTAAHRLKLDLLPAVVRVVRSVSATVAAADVVHVHGNGLLAEAGALVALWRRKPVVLTLYGTEIWHYHARRGIDLFTQMYRRATRVTFYSRGLLDRARDLGLNRAGLSVVYPPVADAFTWHDASGQASARQSLNLRNRHVLVNVKRLHPLAGQRFLIEAMGEIVRWHPDTRLVICGTGPLRAELESIAQSCGVSAHVIFAGLVENRAIARYCAAADLFVLPSLLEACPTVALEALAAGTPVVSSDNPGGVELQRLFDDDVQVVPRERSGPLAARLMTELDHKHRTTAATRAIIERDFRPPAVAAQFWRVYHEARSDRVAPRGPA